MNVISYSAVIENSDDPSGIKFAGLVELTPQEVSILKKANEENGDGEFAGYIAASLRFRIAVGMRYVGINVHSDFPDKSIWYFEMRMVDEKQRSPNRRAVSGQC